MKSELEIAAINWYEKRRNFCSADNKLIDNPNWKTLLNECSKAEHNLAAAVRKYMENNL